MYIQSSNEMKRYNHLGSEINAAYHEMSQQLGLSDSAMTILYTICGSGDSCLLQDICRFSGISKQTVNSAVRKLEREGIAYLEAAGGKNKRIRLTEAGKRLAEGTALRIIQAENDIFSSWEREDVERYLALTERFLEDIRKETRKIKEESV